MRGCWRKAPMGNAPSDDGSLAIRHASEAVLILTSGSSYNGFDKSPSRAGKDESVEAQTALEQAAKKSFAQSARRTCAAITVRSLIG